MRSLLYQESHSKTPRDGSDSHSTGDGCRDTALKRNASFPWNEIVLSEQLGFSEPIPTSHLN